MNIYGLLMEKIIKKYGNALIIRFDKEDVKIYDLNEGDILNIELEKIKKNQKIKGGLK